MVTVTKLVAVLLAGLLLYSGSGKLLAPADLSAALAEIVRTGRSYRRVVRVMATAEVAVSVLLTLRPELPLTRVAVGGLGASFAAAGIAGRVRRAERPCGCFGSSSAGSLGLWNAAVGLVFVLWACSPWQQTYGWAVSVVATLVVATVIPSWGRRRYLFMLVTKKAVRERAG